VHDGLRLQFDWGVLVSGPQGTEVIERIYWANKATTIISDEAAEAMITPKLWGHVIFHGGIDTQHALPTATVEEAADHARTMIEAFEGGSGYIFAPSQIFQTDIPVENIFAAYEVAINHNAESGCGVVRDQPSVGTRLHKENS
jgi:hypothetical protein